MNVFLKKLYFVLPFEDLLRIGKLTILLTLVAVMEVFGLALISFLLINIQNLREAIESILLFSQAISFFEISGDNAILIFCIFVIAYSLLTLTSSIAIIRSLNISGQFIGSRIRQEILSYYLDSDWFQTSNINVTEKVSKIINDGRQVGYLVIFSLHLFSRFILCVFIIAGLFIFSPLLTMALVSILLFSYTLITFFISPLIKKHGSNTSKMMNSSMQILSNIFGSVKEIIFYDVKHEFISKYKSTDSNLVYAEAHNAFYSQIPRFLIDSIILIILVLLIAFFSGSEFNSEKIFASISVFGLAGLKVLPSFQNIYYFYYEIIYRQVQLSNVAEIFKAIELKSEPIHNNIFLEHSISFKNVNFNFEAQNPTLHDISFEFNRNNNIAIIGPSGSGKSTLLDLILGLTSPQSGKIFFDDLEITSRNRDSIRSNFAFVPQKVQLIEGTLKENILFGSTLSNDNKDVFLKAISLAELDEVIESLPNGLNTVISETNPIVSGGQKQCIGFARAFFKQRHILVLDEATSAMDQSLEAKIINNISIIQFKMVIAITHKGSILEYFNKICILQDGKIEACDSFSKLEPKNIFLKQMLEKN